MADTSCTVRIKAGLKHPRRSVAFLEEHSASNANAGAVFSGLVGSEARYYSKSFDYWMGGFFKPRRYHGWNKTQHKVKYTECFVFKNVSEGERFYGFLCRPKPGDGKHEMCVLVLYAAKKKWRTDTAELERAERLRLDPEILVALKDPNLFKEGVGKKK